VPQPPIDKAGRRGRQRAPKRYEPPAMHDESKRVKRVKLRHADECFNCGDGAPPAAWEGFRDHMAGCQ
jgi:hypothetical protein